MNIAVIGRGNVGGGLARRWERAGHTIIRIGRDGGDGADAQVALVAVPSGAITDALGKVGGLQGKVTIDATNAYAGRDPPTPRWPTRSSRWLVARSPRHSTSTSPSCMTKSTSSGCRPATCMRPRTARGT